MKSWFQQIPSGLVTILAILAGLAVFYWLGQRDANATRDVDVWRASSEAVLKMGKAHRARVDSLEGSERAQAALALRLRHERDAARQEVAQARRRRDSLRLVAAAEDLRELAPKLQLIARGPDLFETDSAGVRFLGALRVEAIGSRDIIAGLELSEAKADSTILAYVEAARIGLEVRNLLKARVDTLEIQLDVGLAVTDCKFLLLFNCPSRTTVFIVGSVLGAATVGVVVAVTK